jgi:WD40 repeat protein
MAPEQARASKDVSTAADVYGLGALLYELLTGRPPFRAATVMETLLQVMEQEPADPRSVRPGVDRDLAGIALRCLEKGPGDRYESAAALADDLERWLAGEPVAVRPVGRLSRAGRWARRRPAEAALVFAGVLLCLALPAAVAWHLTALQEEQTQAANERADLEAGARVEAERLQGETAAALRRVERSLGASLVGQAFTAWRDSQREDAIALLEECPKDLRGWDWRFVRRLCRPGLYALSGHTAPVKAVTCSSDGTRWASASVAEVILWDAVTGGELRRFAHPGHAVAFSPDGALVASSSRDQGIKVWEAATGTPRLAIEGRCFGGVAFSPDGKTLAAGGYLAQDAGQGKARADRLRLWDVTTGKVTLRLNAQDDLAAGVAFSPDGGTVAAECADVLVAYDVRTAKQTFSETISMTDYPHPTHGVEFSPDGRLLAAMVFAGPYATPTRYRLLVFDRATRGRVLDLPGPSAWTTNLAFSPDGARLAAGCERDSVKVWEVRTGKELVVLRGAGANCVAFTPDGRGLLVGGQDRTVQVWDARFGSDLLALHQVPLIRGEYDPYAFGAGNSYHHAIPHPPSPAAALSPDGRQLALSLDGGTPEVLDVASGNPLFRVPLPAGGRLDLAFAPRNESLLLAAESRVVLCDPRTGGVRLSADCPPGELGGTFQEPVIEPGGRRFLLPTGKGVEVRETASGRVLTFLEGCQLGNARSPTFSRDGRWLAAWVAGNGPQTSLAFWDLRSGRRAHPRLPPAAGFQGFSPDGRLAYFVLTEDRGERSTVSAWAVESREQAFSRAETGVVRQLTISPDGRLIAWSPDGHQVPNARDVGVVTVADARTGAPLRRLRGHGETAQELAFTPDGERLLALTSGSVRVWDPRSGQIVLTINGSLSRVFGGSTPPHMSLLTLGGLSALEGLGASFPSTDAEAPPHGRAIRLLHARPERDWHLRCGAAAYAKKDWYAAVFHHHRAGPLNGYWLAKRSNAHAELARWPEAVADLARGLSAAVKPEGSLETLAMAQFAAGQVDGYRKSCEAALWQRGRRADLRRAAAAVGLFGAPGPGGLGGLQSLRKTAEAAVEGCPQTVFALALMPDGRRDAEAMSALAEACDDPATKALALVRAGLDEDSRRALAVVHRWRAPDPALKSLVAALAQLKGNRAAAEAHYKEACRLLDAPAVDNSRWTWEDRLLHRTLRGEVAGRLKVKP